MLTLTLLRISNHTLGALVSANGVVCYTMEPPWRNNARNVSCIPEGSYMVEYLPRSASGKYKDCYHVTNVDKRGGILIHKGNTVRDTLGCILPGTKLGHLGNQRAVLGSASAMRKLHKLTGRKRFKLNVRNFITTG